MPAVCNSMLPRSLSLGYHAYIICILSSSVYSNLYHIFFFTYNWSHKLELLYTFMFSIFLFGIFNDSFRLTFIIIVFVMLKLHDFLSLLKKYPYLKIKYERFGFCIQLQTTYIMDGDGMTLFYCSYFLWAVISQQFIIPQRNLLPEYN